MEGKTPKNYDDYVDLRNDGRIVMYRRPHLKNPKWNVRLKIPNTKGYVIRSTKTSDFNEGKRFSEDLYYELEGKIRRGEVITSPQFEKVVNEWIGEIDVLFREQSEQYKNGNKQISISHLKPFFGKTPIDEITEDLITTFVSLQFQNNFSNVTVRHHLTVLKKIFDFGRRKGYLTTVPPIPKPKLKINSRSDFTKDEWRKLYEFMREWIKHPNSRIHRQRFYTQQYVLILGNSGIRCGTEMRSLKWSDISTTKDLIGDERVVITVKGKTDRRDVICNVGIERYFKRLYEFRTKELGHPPSPSECVLVNPNGKPIKSYKGSFNTLLQKVGLDVDSDGKKRTPYSLRHTYITMRLMEGVNIYQLSSNVGTSIDMIELYYGHLRNRDPNVVSEVTKNSFTKDQPSKIDFLFN